MREMAGVSRKCKRPDPEVEVITKRRNLTVAYKLRILDRLEKCDNDGEKGALLRKEGLYASNVKGWKDQRDSGQLFVSSPKKRGRKKQERNPFEKEMKAMQRKITKLEQKLGVANTIIDAQKKISELWGIQLSSLNGAKN